MDFNGQLVIGGNFTIEQEPPIEGVATWNGSGWEALGNGLTGSGSKSVRSMGVLGCDLFIVGLFNEVDNDPQIRSIARWDGAGWNALPELDADGVRLNYIRLVG